MLFNILICLIIEFHILIIVISGKTAFMSLFNQFSFAYRQYLFKIGGKLFLAKKLVINEQKCKICRNILRFYKKIEVKWD